MSSALTFYFKDIFSNYSEFKSYLTEYNIFNTTSALDNTFAEFVFKTLFRQFCNSNIQYDTPDDFKNDLANILEDNMLRYQKRLDLVKKAHALTDDELILLSKAIANTSVNPNTVVDDPSEPIEYISTQASTYAKDNKLQAFLKAIELLPNQYMGEMISKCKSLFKSIIPNQVFLYEGREIYEDWED